MGLPGLECTKSLIAAKRAYKKSEDRRGADDVVGEAISCQKAKEEDELEKERKQKESITLSRIFQDSYIPYTKMNKGLRSVEREKSLFRIWIEPEIGQYPLKDILPAHLELIKKKMADAEQSARSVRYALAVIRQVFNYAKFNKTYEGQSPVANVKFPQADNKRLRFLTQEEAK